jgi:hypothetical protein
MACKVAFRFSYPERLKDAYCPNCGDKLRATIYCIRWPWNEQDALDYMDAYHLREHRRFKGLT